MFLQNCSKFFRSKVQVSVIVIMYLNCYPGVDTRRVSKESLVQTIITMLAELPALHTLHNRLKTEAFLS